MKNYTAQNVNGMEEFQARRIKALVARTAMLFLAAPALTVGAFGQAAAAATSAANADKTAPVSARCTVQVRSIIS